mmetsp:Transcript_50535/g.118943  ORF Transcript_50535/g.118943 Transcript_50535/m.118943 type:complete len:293 (-) Transcript_50535:434-1312(-)
MGNSASDSSVAETASGIVAQTASVLGLAPKTGSSAAGTDETNQFFQSVSIPSTRDNVEAIRKYGVHVSEELENDFRKTSLTLQKRPARNPGMQQIYTVYNVQVSNTSKRQTASAGAVWTPLTECAPATPLSLRATWCFRQNHTCITQLLLRVCNAETNEVERSFRIASEVFSIDSRERTLNIESFAAPQTPGKYYVDFITDWQYRFADVKVEGKKSAGCLAFIHVGQAVPWEKERVVWLGHAHAASLFGRMSKDVVYKILARCGDWRQGCACHVCCHRKLAHAPQPAQPAAV